MSGCSWRLKLGGRGLGSYWHAAKLRLTHVFFPLGFIALVRAGSPDPPVLCDRRSPSPRSLARHLETSGRPNGVVRACHAVFLMIFLESSIDFPDEWYLQPCTRGPAASTPTPAVTPCSPRATPFS